RATLPLLLSSLPHPRSTPCFSLLFFFLNDTAPTEIYTLSLHDALPISPVDESQDGNAAGDGRQRRNGCPGESILDRPYGGRRGRSEEHTSELQSLTISYAVFCLKKKTQTTCNSHSRLHPSSSRARALHP